MYSGQCHTSVSYPYVGDHSNSGVHFLRRCYHALIQTKWLQLDGSDGLVSQCSLWLSDASRGKGRASDGHSRRSNILSVITMLVSLDLIWSHHMRKSDIAGSEPWSGWIFCSIKTDTADGSLCCGVVLKHAWMCATCAFEWSKYKSFTVSTHAVIGRYRG